MLSIIVLFVALFPTELFFSINLILGTSYTGSDSSPAFAVFMTFRFVLVLLYLVLKRKEKNRISGRKMRKQGES